MKRKLRMTGLLVCLIAALLVPTAASAAGDDIPEIWEITLTPDTVGVDITGSFDVSITGGTLAATIPVGTGGLTAKSLIEAAWANTTVVGVSDVPGAEGGVFSITIFSTGAGINLATATVAATDPTAGTTAETQTRDFAAAADQTDGDQPPELGDPVGTNVSPHGQYSSATDYCLQCHSVHLAPDATTDIAGDGPSSYALMRQGNVVAVCATCHGLQGSAGTIDFPTGLLAFDPGFDPPAEATVATRAAYTTDGSEAEHSIGATDDPDGYISANLGFTQSNWQSDDNADGKLTYDLQAGTDIAAGDGVNLTGSGLYCASCHAPHGNYGQMVNNWTKPTQDTTADEDELTQITFVDTAGFTRTGWYLDFSDNSTPADLTDDFWLVASTTVVRGDGTTQACTPDATPVLGSTCVYAMIRDGANQMSSLYGYKLLTAFPNHDYGLSGTPGSWGVVASNQDGSDWCGTCHVPRANDATNGYHNHDTGCDFCHGNARSGTSGVGYDGTPTEFDFPHSSSSKAKFLYDIPDALCITCHTPGNLP